MTFCYCSAPKSSTWCPVRRNDARRASLSLASASPGASTGADRAHKLCDTPERSDVVQVQRQTLCITLTSDTTFDVVTRCERTRAFHRSASDEWLTMSVLRRSLKSSTHRSVRHAGPTRPREGGYGTSPPPALLAPGPSARRSLERGLEPRQWGTIVPDDASRLEFQGCSPL